MEIIEVDDLAQKRRFEQIDAGQSEQDGLIDYIACMADIELPEDEGASADGTEEPNE